MDDFNAATNNQNKNKNLEDLIDLEHWDQEDNFYLKEFDLRSEKK
jgi:hypothetical protein